VCRSADDRLDVFIGGTHHLATCTVGWVQPSGKQGPVVNYRHMTSWLRRKPMALLNLVHRNQLSRQAYRRTSMSPWNGCQR
jgi:hypothetical protein